MVRKILHGMFAVAVLAAAGCATTPGPGGSLSTPPVTDRITALDRALETETDDEKISVLLFERGHAYLEKAELIRDEALTSKDKDAGVRYATVILYALRDFEAVVKEFPASPSAPESLYHLGVVYDYPNISSFGPALKFYQRTVDEYPGTEPALRAQEAIKKIHDNARQVMEGSHRKGI